ncbi:MAG: GNAT family N-acetyltransferase [Bacillota bacterium]
MDIAIRRAFPDESSTLTEITLKSKGYWNYPEEYMQIWKDELTITESYIEKNAVYVAEINNGIIAGYYSIVNNEKDLWIGNVYVHKGYWLDHLFIMPGFMGIGIGSALLNHAKDLCRGVGCKKLSVFADPNSRGFYVKLGAIYLRESPSSIQGRNIPVFELAIPRNDTAF